MYKIRIKEYIMSKKSTPSPHRTIEKSIRAAQLISKKLGNEGWHHQDTIAHIWNYSNGTRNGAFRQTAGALKGYGLIMRERNHYKLTPFAKRLLASQDDSTHQLMIEAVLKCDLYKSIYDRYRGGALPDQFQTILMTDFGVLESRVKNTESVFRKTMKSIGLLQNDQLTARDSIERAPTLNQNTAVTKLKTTDTPAVELKVDYGNGRTAMLTVPKDITEDERSKLMAFLKNI